MIPRRSLLCSACVVALTLPATVWADGELQVVASFSILGDMVEQIGGDHVTVTTLVGPGGDTHVYSPTPQDARAVAGAEVMIINGLEFEGWLERLTEAAAFDGALVVATTGIDAIAYETDDHGDSHEEHADHGDHDHGDHDDGDGHDHDHDQHAHDDHDHGAFDPHAWQSLTLAVIYVDNITAALATADPDNASAYYANRAAYVAEIEALNVEISAMMAAVPSDKRTVVTSHDAFGYFAAEYGLNFVAPQGLSTESEASAADVAALITQIRDEGISAVFLETITDNRLMEQIANETNAVIGGTLYTGALSGPDGPAATYLEMMRHNATTLAAALGN